jgi:tetratricopeptide (TPR) repeat protein
MNSSSFAPYQVAMLIGGGILFLVAVGLVVYLTVKRRATKPALLLFPLSILMLGFPSISKFSGFGFELEVAVREVETKARAVEENPNDENAKKELRVALGKVESNVSPGKTSSGAAEKIAAGHEALRDSDRAIEWANAAVKKDPNSARAHILLDRAEVTKALPLNLSGPLTPAVRANLSAATDELAKHHDSLMPEERLTLAHAQMALGNTNAAKTNLQTAVKANPKLAARADLLRKINFR